MPQLQSISNDFLEKITGIVEKNLSNEQFGVSELAAATNMSRSNLLRKVKKLTGLSVSQFIRQVRLRKAMEILRDGSLKVSEISWQVGFSSTSYFIKCFREQYGYPPGDVSKQDFTEEETEIVEKPGKGKARVFLVATVVVVLVGVLLVLLKPFSKKAPHDKSIAVLPFKNDSNDSTNIYFVNGLMESVLTNLQKIKDLRVISRTSVEKYRNSSKTIPEIAKDLNVSYFIEGSGQKIGDQVLLHIQLIEAADDKHLWAEKYNRETSDIFNLQAEIAKSITDEIQVILTPEEQERIAKPPTDNLVAYDYYLKGLEPFNAGTREGLEEAIPFFEKALEQDPEFAQAYANLAIAYYFLDLFQSEKKYSSRINNYADKALFYDDKLSAALLAKAFFYMSSNENKLAEPYLQKALQYSPNSAFVINTLSDFYDSRIPNTRKYLEYALKGLQIDVGSSDSTSRSYLYLHLANALIQSGFADEAEKYINKSIAYDPSNLFSAYVKPYILYAKNKDMEALRNGLLEVHQRDTTRIDIIQEIGKVYYYLRDYPKSYEYYKKFLAIKKAQQLDVYRFENAKIAFVLAKMGQKQQADSCMNDYLDYAQQDPSVYKDLSLAVYYANANDIEEAMDHLRKFSQQTNFHYWTILFLDQDPLVDKLKKRPEFKQVFREIENRFWKNQREIKANLEAKKLL